MELEERVGERQGPDGTSSLAVINVILLPFLLCVITHA